MLLHVFILVLWCRVATVALPACNRGATGSYRDITKQPGQHRGIPARTVLHRKCSVVNRGSTGALLSREPGLYRGNVGNVRTQFIFYEMCPVHHGIPAVLHRDEPWLHQHSENGALESHSFFIDESGSRFSHSIKNICNTAIFFIVYVVTCSQRCRASVV